MPKGQNRRGMKKPTRPKLQRNYQDEPLLRLGRSLDLQRLQPLLESADDERFQTLALLFLDPAYRKMSFQTLAKKAGLTGREIQDLYIDGQRHEALVQMSHALPQLMENVVQDAASSPVTCPRCDGDGQVPSGESGVKTCPVCEGHRKILKIGDRHARDLVFESAKLIHQSSSTMAVQTNIHIGDDRLETMLKKTRQLILPDKKQELLPVETDEKHEV